MKLKSITICSSASFYKQVVEVEKDLKKLGFRVKIPYTAEKMKKNGSFDLTGIKTWYQNPADFKRKTKLMNGHLWKILKADAILVVNHPKNGVEGYIGGNGLIEMFYAFINKKPIFVLNQVSQSSQLYEEILGLKPVFIDNDFSKIKL